MKYLALLSLVNVAYQILRLAQDGLSQAQGGAALPATRDLSEQFNQRGDYANGKGHQRTELDGNA